MSRRLALVVMSLVERLTPPRRRDWARAMRQELDYASGGGLGWAMGCLWAAAVERARAEAEPESSVRRWGGWMIGAGCLITAPVLAWAMWPSIWWGFVREPPFAPGSRMSLADLWRNLLPTLSPLLILLGGVLAFTRPLHVKLRPWTRVAIAIGLLIIGWYMLRDGGLWGFRYIRGGAPFQYWISAGAGFLAGLIGMAAGGALALGQGPLFRALLLAATPIFAYTIMRFHHFSSPLGWTFMLPMMLACAGLPLIRPAPRSA